MEKTGMEAGKTVRAASTLEIHFGCVGDAASSSASQQKLLLGSSTTAMPCCKRRQVQAAGLSSGGIPLVQRFGLDLVGKMLMGFF